MNPLNLAFIHASFRRTENNEVLEFLGDAILQLIVTEHLISLHPGKSEGWYSQSRSTYVCTDRLALIARRRGFRKRLILGGSAEFSGGRDNVRILAGCVEAYIAAVYLTRGYEAARNWLLTAL